MPIHHHKPAARAPYLVSDKRTAASSFVILLFEWLCLCFVSTFYVTSSICACGQLPVFELL
jgi:hypothetical protein